MTILSDSPGTMVRGLFLAVAIAFAPAHALAQWSSDPQINTRVSVDPQSFGMPQIASDANGGAFFAWIGYDQYDHFNGVFAQHLDASGFAQCSCSGYGSLFPAEGNPSLSITGDGAGGAIFSNGGYAQRVGPPFAPHWNAFEVLPFLPSGQKDTKVVTDGAGGAIIATTYSDHILIHRLDPSGVRVWSPAGISIPITPPVKGELSMVSDGNGGAILVCIGKTFSDRLAVFAHHIDHDGALPWGTAGVQVSNGTSSVPDGSQAFLAHGDNGSVYVSWTNRPRRQVRPGLRLFAQKVSSDGRLEWRRTGINIAQSGRHYGLVSDDSGGAVILFANPENSQTLMAQRITSEGALQWDREGVLVGGNSYNSPPQMIGDGAGGAIITWNTTDCNIYAQKLDESGTQQWAAAGVPICTAPGCKYRPQLISDDAGGAIIGWSDSRNEQSIYASKVDANGNLVGSP